MQQHVRRQGTQNRAHRQAGKHRIIDHCQGQTCFHTAELLCEWSGRDTHQIVASLPILLSGDLHAAYHGKPPGAPVQLLCHALAGLANADCHGKRRMTPLPHQPAELVLELQDDHALGVTAHQRQQLLAQLESDRLLPVSTADIITQVVVNIKHLRCGCSVGSICGHRVILFSAHRKHVFRGIVATEGSDGLHHRIDGGGNRYPPGLPRFDPKIAYLYDALYDTRVWWLEVLERQTIFASHRVSSSVISLRKKIADLPEDERRSRPTPVTL